MLVMFREIELSRTIILTKCERLARMQLRSITNKIDVQDDSPVFYTVHGNLQNFRTKRIKFPMLYEEPHFKNEHQLKSGLMYWCRASEYAPKLHDVTLSFSPSIKPADIIPQPKFRYFTKKSYIDNFKWKGKAIEKEEMD
uniref:Uncharacterized protein n=1 Tax=Euplotes harpa TaxID=151035 RepID=A0A7S3J5J9_9SPIT|mmetsp:Transcript_21418/g.24609  ORF Transcript_21418/g.24609 Transcript_21418/m.24609 type:complete len:140 (+) Transcript_21418:134-553(+)